MNVSRMIVLSVAFAAAGGAALLVRSGMGGPKTVQAASGPQMMATEDVLVAGTDVAVGHGVDVMAVRWQKWPTDAINASFIVRTKQPDLTKDVAGAIARVPLVAGQPITDANIVRAGTAGFMAATITPGMRALAVPVSPETGAGGFILPNDRVDVLLTRDFSAGGAIKRFISETILKDVRVLAVDQTVQQEKDKQTVIGRTATVELKPDQAEVAAQAIQSGVLSLALRSLGDSNGVPLTIIAEKRPPVLPTRTVSAGPAGPRPPAVFVYRYGVLQAAGAQSAAIGAGTTPAFQTAAAVSDVP